MSQPLNTTTSGCLVSFCERAIQLFRGGSTAGARSGTYLLWILVKSASASVVISLFVSGENLSCWIHSPVTQRLRLGPSPRPCEGSEQQRKHENKEIHFYIRQ